MIFRPRAIAALALTCLFSAPAPAPQIPLESIQRPKNSQISDLTLCAPSPPVEINTGSHPCQDYWSVRGGSASNTAELRQLRLIMEDLDTRISRLETKDNNNG
jgi:hypothetical protein